MHLSLCSRTTIAAESEIGASNNRAGNCVDSAAWVDAADAVTGAHIYGAIGRYCDSIGACQQRLCCRSAVTARTGLTVACNRGDNSCAVNATHSRSVRDIQAAVWSYSEACKGLETRLNCGTAVSGA